MVRMAAGHELDAHVGEDAPALAEIAGDLGDVGPVAIDFEKTTLGFEDALLGKEAHAGRLRRIHAEHGGEPCVIFAGEAGIGRCVQPPH